MKNAASAKSTKTKPVFVSVECSRPLDEMIKAGKYDWVSKEITHDHFQVNGNGQSYSTSLALFHFNRYTTSDEVIEEMKEESYCPATIEELLAYGEVRPTAQLKYPIAALGSIWVNLCGYPSVPFLWGTCRKRNFLLSLFGSRGGKDERCLGLNSLDRWNSAFWFLARSK